jgi:hypothetical protein
MIIATDIETSLWNRILEHLIAEGWSVSYKYDNYDAGIDSDFVILQKEQEEILFGWDNWFEGEIQASESHVKSIEENFRIQFNYGEPVNLKPGVIDLHRKWKNDNLFNSSTRK